jgi:putative two-component system response regulator
MQNQKKNILIVDDSEMNRSILADMLGDEYEVIEAENGIEAVAVIQKMGAEIDLVLLDIVMPEMDGFGVLMEMNKDNWIEEIPVIMISAESAPARIERAYELGVTDFISRPFDELIVRRRVVNTILLYAKQKKLIGLVADQIYEKEQQSSLMIDVLSHIVEFRNGESGMHVLHVRTLTEMLLRCLVRKTNEYQLSHSDIALISTASALHDIGKIAIPSEILNKPGKLTNEEFAVMKTHSEVGATMLKDLPMYKNEPLVKYAYEICRWHHERYDGRGYPDGLVGDDIPISAQIVALADVYDALTSERVYKKAFSHETAVQMILEGQCGTFNPLVMECLRDMADQVQKELNGNVAAIMNERKMRNVAEELRQHEELTTSERTLRLLEHERMKYSFFADMSQEIQFEYTISPPMVTISAWGAQKMGLDEIIRDPLDNEKVLSLFKKEDLQGLSDALHSTTPENPIVTYDFQMNINGEKRWTRILSRATWSSDEPPRYTGAIGKAQDIHEERMKMATLEQMAFHDSLTGLLNHAHARQKIKERLEQRPSSQFALAILDMDRFKQANDTYGHLFGDRVLIYLASRMRKIVRSGDIVARVGGDEFMIFMEYRSHIESGIHRVFNALLGEYRGFPISVSMGVATTDQVGLVYEDLFHAADQALYEVKRNGKGCFRFYDSAIQETNSVISPIDSDQ